jgi:hypothetical protein
MTTFYGLCVMWEWATPWIKGGRRVRWELGSLPASSLPAGCWLCLVLYVPLSIVPYTHFHSTYSILYHCIYLNYELREVTRPSQVSRSQGTVLYYQLLYQEFIQKRELGGTE